MLTLQETIWQLARNKGRTLILLLASAMLAGCMAFYLSNIRANEEANDRMAQVMPVSVTATNTRGEKTDRLNINAHRYDGLMSSPYLKDFTCTIHAVGEFSEEARENSPFADPEAEERPGMAPYNGGDCTVRGLYSLEGYDFEGGEAVCVLDPVFAESCGIEEGDEISLPIYTMTYVNELGYDVEYTPLGEQTLRVAGIGGPENEPGDIFVPAVWMRKVMDDKGLAVNYNELGAMLKDPRQLNVFKESIQDMGFLDIMPESMDMFTGAVLVVDDQRYVTAAEPLGQTVTLYRRFQVPFFVLVIGMIVLAIFLIMRGSRRVMAISVSLGRPRFLCAMGCFLAALIAELAGCALVLPVMVLLGGLSLEGALMICGAFLICASAGNILALMLLLRFNAFTLLTAVE